MLWTIAILLLALWAVGFLTSYTLGGLLHVLLVIAAVIIVLRLLGKKV